MAKRGGLVNLDYLAAKYAQEIVAELVDKRVQQESVDIKKAKSSADNTVTKALGVLQEHGVYACFLYLFAKEKENSKAVVPRMLEILREIGIPDPPSKAGKGSVDSRGTLAHISEHVTSDLELLLLARDALERLLVYARYGIKARG